MQLKTIQGAGLCLVGTWAAVWIAAGVQTKQQGAGASTSHLRRSTANEL